MKTKMEEEFYCVVCDSLPVDVVESNCCASLFCWECAVKINTSCPTCNKSFSREDCRINLPLRRAIDNVPRKCKYETCSKMIKGSEEYHRHSLTCHERPIVCPNSELCGILAARDLENHLSTKCEYRILPCHLCEKEILIKNLPNHLEHECTGVKIRCPNNCSVEVKRIEMENHRNECSFEKIPCEFNFCGCSAQFKRMDAADHSENPVVIRRHLQLLSLYVQKQQEQINKIENRNTQNIQDRNIQIQIILDRIIQIASNVVDSIRPSHFFIAFGVFILFHCFPDILTLLILIGSIGAIRSEHQKVQTRHRRLWNPVLSFLYFIAFVCFCLLIL